jgi:hypothetical protein
LSGVILVYFSAGLSRLTRASRTVSEERAFVLAEAGFQSVEALLNAGEWKVGSVLDWSTDVVDNDGDLRIDEGDESLRVTVEFWGTDDIDNDGDGRVDEEDEDVVRAVSTVDLGTTSRTLVAWLRRMTAFLPVPPGAVALNDPFATVRFNGNAFSIDGRDRDDPEGHDGVDNDGDGEVDEADEHTSATGFGSDINSISIQGDPDAVTAQFDEKQLDNLTGLGGVGAATVGGYDPGDPQFVHTILEHWSPLATTVFESFQGTYTGNLGDWNTRDFEIVKSNGDLHLGGGGSGAGILIVDGNLTITGGYSFWGYVFVTGNLSLRGTSNKKGLRGAAFVAGDLGTEEDLTLSGAASFTYSSEVLGQIRTTLAEGYRLLAITEIPPSY